MSDTDPRLLLLSPEDNILVLRAAITAGEAVMVTGQTVTVPLRIGLGHKLARRAIAAGDKVLKYGAPVGSATRDIAVGDHVHLHNLKSDYIPSHSLEAAKAQFGDGS